MIRSLLTTLIALATPLLASCGNQANTAPTSTSTPRASDAASAYRVDDAMSQRLGITCYHVPASVFMMGDPDAAFLNAVSNFTAESYTKGAWPVRETEITTPYIITELVPAELYLEFLNDQPPDARSKLINGAMQGRITLTDQEPVITPGTEGPVNVVRWAGANAFCAWLSQKHDVTARLPTEAEWELWMQYRKGVDQVVGKDITGAWCADYYDERLSPADNIDPLGPTTSSFQADYGYQCRVIRRFTERYHPRMPASEHTRADAWIYGIQIVIELD
jgi:formylglycine-generating enzyme required for sulfatase activity